MITNERLIEAVLTELPRSVTNKPWMTAEAIAKKIDKNQNIKIEADTLETVLVKESSCLNRRIRYSMYPSANSLRVLWGAISSVKERNLPSLVLDRDEKQEEISLNLSDDNHFVFISHNYRDQDGVVELCKEVEDAGIPCWIFETKIRDGEAIINEVREAIDRTPLCILYLSKNSIGSTWVRKEVMNVRGGIKLVVGSSDDRDLISYLSQLRSPPEEIPESLLEHCKSDLQIDSARSLFDYIYHCFIKDGCKIYLHGNDSASHCHNELIEDIKYMYENRNIV